MKTKIVSLFWAACLSLLVSTSAWASALTPAYFHTVHEAQQYQWQSIDLGKRVYTYEFNAPIEQSWQLQQADPALTGGFGVVAGNYYLALTIPTTGVTLKALGGVPSSQDPLFDNVEIWQQAQQLGVPILLDDFYAGTRSFEVLTSGLTVRGNGTQSSGLVGTNAAQPVLITRTLANNETHSNVILENFGIQGVGKSAAVLTHLTVSKVDNIALEGFQGQDGFVFEYLWGNQIGLLKSNGAVLSGTPFKWNSGVIDTLFGHLYSSNLVDVNFDFNNSRFEYSSPVATGDGVNTIMLLTAQGANEVAIKMQGLSRYKILNVYTENCQEILHLTGTVSDIAISGDFQGVRSTTQRSVLVDGNVSGLSLQDVSFPSALIEIGKINADVHIDSPRVTGNQDIVALIRRNANTPSSMPLTIDYQGTSMSKKLMKTNGWSWKFQSLYIDNNGQWQSDLITIPSI